MLNTTRLSAFFGARIDGVDLMQHDDTLVDEIREALTEHKLLVIPDQASLTPERLLRFSEHFGEAEKVPHPNWKDVPDFPGVKLIATANYPTGPDVEDSWHTDGPPREHTQWYSFLHAINVPDYGRDTLFADMSAAYARLSPPLQQFLEGLTAFNSWGASKPEAPPVEHPVVMTDPDTGVKSLYVNRLYTNSIKGLRREESDALLELLYRQTNVPELQCRVSWQPGTLTLWDNEKTQHYVVRDRPYDRLMHRVMVCTGR